MTEVLSQDIIDNLLGSIGEVSDDNGGLDSGHSDESGVTERKIKLYDFRHPDRFSKEQMRTIEIMHETFSRLVTNNLSTRLRTPVDVHIASVHQITYEEFIRTVPTPTMFAIIDMQPFNGSAILEIDPAISFSIVERLFGGEGGSVINREMTEIELAVSENIVEIMLGYLREAWRKIVNLRPHLIQIETNPQLAQVVPPSEMLLMILFNCRINNVEGMMNIAIPYITIDPIVSKLSAHTWYASGGSTSTSPKTIEYLNRNVNDLEIDVIAMMGKTTLTMEEIINLKKGDVITMNTVKYKDPINIFVGEEKKYTAIPGNFKGKKAVKIIEVIETNEDLEYLDDDSEMEGFL